MRLAISFLCFLATTAVVLPHQAAALAPQATRTVTSGIELDADDPRAQRATAFVERLLARDPGDAQKYLSAHAVPGSPAATGIAKQVRDMHEALAAGFVVTRVMGGNDDSVLVSLTSKDGERAGGRRGVRLQIEREAPYRIREASTLSSQRRVGGGN